MLHISLRSKVVLFILLSVLGCICAVLSANVVKHDDHDAAQMLKEDGFLVMYTTSTDAFGFSRTRITGLELHLPDFRGKIENGRALINGTPAMEAIQLCQHLYTCDLSNSDVTSNTIGKMTSISKLRLLDLTSTLVDDELLASLRSNEVLNELHLDYTLITDEGLAQLQNSQTLEKLIVGGQFVSGRFLAALKGNQSIRILIVYDSQIDPELLKILPDTAIETLVLSCKPSEIPVSAIVKSSVTWININWDEPLDSADKAAKAKMKSAKPGLEVFAGPRNTT